MKKIISTLTLLMSASISVAHASNSDIIASLNKVGLNKADIKIEDLPIKSIKSVTTPDGIVYITEDGKYLIPGPIYDLQGARPENITDKANRASPVETVKLIATISKDAIEYKAKNEKYVVSVFTDYTCGYCKKLHEEIESYLNSGITVRYFAFPRQGLNSQIATDMQSIWSTKDRKAAFDNAYKGGTISPASSMVPFVKMQYEVGLKIGISGTPAIILPNGEMIPGYMPAAELLKTLDENH